MEGLFAALDRCIDQAVKISCADKLLVLPVVALSDFQSSEADWQMREGGNCLITEVDSGFSHPSPSSILS